MEKIVSTVPFIDFVPFTTHEHNNQDYKRNFYNQITFERKSKLLSNFSLPVSTVDHSENALQAAPSHSIFEKKLDAFASRIFKILSTPPNNIYCDFAAKPNFS